MHNGMYTRNTSQWKMGTSIEAKHRDSPTNRTQENENNCNHFDFEILTDSELIREPRWLFRLRPVVKER